MDSDILISIIVPAYNVAPWLARCLDSICAQSYRNLEILVIDDGSTDETAAIADRYARQDPRVRVIHQENRGLVEVRERGIETASGAFVGFVDGDDEIEPDMMERLLRNARQYGADISQCGILYCFDDGREKPIHGTGETYVFDSEQGTRELLTGSRMEPSLCNKIYKRELLPDSCLDKTAVNNEDLLRNYVLFSRAERSVFEDFCGYRYRRHRGSMSNNSRRKSIAENVLKARRLILENAGGDIRKEALRCYVDALIISYNGTVGKHGGEDAELRAVCREELAGMAGKSGALPRSVRLRILAILRAPLLYDAAYSLHRRAMFARIRRQAEAAKKEKGPDASETE